MGQPVRVLGLGQMGMEGGLWRSLRVEGYSSETRKGKGTLMERSVCTGANRISNP